MAAIGISRCGSYNTFGRVVLHAAIIKTPHLVAAVVVIHLLLPCHSPAFG